MSKTIVYIGGFELPDKNAAAHRVLSNGKAFRELGYNVVFIDSSKDPDTSREILQTKKEHYGFETYSVRYPKGAKAWIKYLTDVKSYIKVIEKQQNVCMVILYNFQAIAMRKLLNYCKKKDIKCCADVTEWRSAKGEGVVYRLLKDSDTWYRMKVLHKKLDGLIVISSYLQKFYSDVKNVVRIPTLVDISEEKWKNPYSKSLDILKLVYAGNPGMKDKLDVLISALEHIKKPYILDIVGLTKEQFLRYYPEFEKKLDSNGVVFHGRISHVTFLESTHPTSKFVSSHPAFYSIAKQCGISFVKEQKFDEKPLLEGDIFPIDVGNDVYIGAGVTIIGPVKIGDGAVIAANATVTHNIEPYTIVAGTPAKVIRKRFSDEDVSFLLESKWWNRELEWYVDNGDAFESVDSLRNLMEGKVEK